MKKNTWSCKSWQWTERFLWCQMSDHMPGGFPVTTWTFHSLRSCLVLAEECKVDVLFQDPTKTHSEDAFSVRLTTAKSLTSSRVSEIQKVDQHAAPLPNGRSCTALALLPFSLEANVPHHSHKTQGDMFTLPDQWDNNQLTRLRAHDHQNSSHNLWRRWVTTRIKIIIIQNLSGCSISFLKLQCMWCEQSWAFQNFLQAFILKKTGKSPHFSGIIMELTGGCWDCKPVPDWPAEQLAPVHFLSDSTSCLTSLSTLKNEQVPLMLSTEVLFSISHMFILTRGVVNNQV